jgi:hypothetical protein
MSIGSSGEGLRGSEGAGTYRERLQENTAICFEHDALRFFMVESVDIDLIASNSSDEREMPHISSGYSSMVWITATTTASGTGHGHAAYLSLSRTKVVAQAYRAVM